MAGPSAPGPFRRRNPGETRYHYYNERSKALFGETLGQRRKRRGIERGLTPREAAGHRNEPAETRRREARELNQFLIQADQYDRERQRREREAEIRRAEERQRIYEEYIFQQEYERDTWLYTHGYTPEQTLLSQNDLRTLYYRLRWIYDNTSERGRITPAMIREAVTLEQEGVLEAGWAFERIWRKYDDMQAYRRYHDRLAGSESWAEYNQVHDYVPQLSPAWWYYH